MNCPKCGHVQAGEQECERCGEISAAARQASVLWGWKFAMPFQEVKTELAQDLGGL